MKKPGKVKKQWERLDKETPKAWFAFCLYRDLDPRERSIRRAFELYRDLPKDSHTGKLIPGYFNDWYQRLSWRDRANAHDEHLDAERLAEASQLNRRIRIAARDGLLRAIEAQVDAIEKETDSGKISRLANSLRETLQAFDEDFGEPEKPPVTPAQIRPQLDNPPPIIKHAAGAPRWPGEDPQ